MLFLSLILILSTDTQRSSNPPTNESDHRWIKDGKPTAVLANGRRAEASSGLIRRTLPSSGVVVGRVKEAADCLAATSAAATGSNSKPRKAPLTTSAYRFKNSTTC